MSTAKDRTSPNVVPMRPKQPPDLSPYFQDGWVAIPRQMMDAGSDPAGFLVTAWIIMHVEQSDGRGAPVFGLDQGEVQITTSSLASTLSLSRKVVAHRLKRLQRTGIITVRQSEYRARHLIVTLHQPDLFGIGV